MKRIVIVIALSILIIFIILLANIYKFTTIDKLLHSFSDNLEDRNTSEFDIYFLDRAKIINVNNNGEKILVGDYEDLKSYISSKQSPKIGISFLDGSYPYDDNLLKMPKYKYVAFVHLPDGSSEEWEVEFKFKRSGLLNYKISEWIIYSNNYNFMDLNKTERQR